MRICQKGRALGNGWQLKKKLKNTFVHKNNYTLFQEGRALVMDGNWNYDACDGLRCVLLYFIFLKKKFNVCHLEL